MLDNVGISRFVVGSLLCRDCFSGSSVFLPSKSNPSTLAALRGQILVARWKQQASNQSGISCVHSALSCKERSDPPNYTFHFYLPFDQCFHFYLHFFLSFRFPWFSRVRKLIWWQRISPCSSVGIKSPRIC